MKIFLLSLLAIGSVHSLSIGYPYRTGLLAYNPSRGEFPVQSSLVQGYLRYLDSHGVERLVGYRYPEPVYGIRQVSYVRVAPAISTPVIRTYAAEESGEFAKAREAHFRAWSLQQYQALKSEIDAFRAMGKETPADLMEKYRPLEKIALTSNFNSIAELPEVKRVRDEHLGLWSAARIQDLQLEAGHKPIGEIKTYVEHAAPLVPVEETAEQKLARQEHLRFYQEQLNRVQQLQMQADGILVEGPVSTQSPILEEPINRLASTGDGLTEVERATQEHLRLWNEAKLRAEQASLRDEEEAKHNEMTFTMATEKSVPESAAQLRKAHEEHLRLVNEAMGQKQVSQLKINVPSEQTHDQSEVVVDTPELVKAREEHLRLVNEAKLKAESLEHKQDVSVTLVKDASHEHQDGLTEVERATKEHLRLWNEAKLRAEQASLRDEEEAKRNDLKSTAVTDQTVLESAAELRKAHEEHLRFVNEATAKIREAQAQSEQKQVSQLKVNIPAEQPHHQSEAVVDTPEVVKAREEHLRLVNEAKLRAEGLEHKHDVSGPLVKVAPLEPQQGLIIASHPAQPVVVADTLEVLKARREHLRLVQEAETKLQSLEQQIRKESQMPFQLQSQMSDSAASIHNLRYKDEEKTKALSMDTQVGIITSLQQQPNVLPEDTPEVMQAREQHLRIFNAVKAYIEKEENSKSQQEQPVNNPIIEEQLLLEEERLREAERLRAEQKQLEMDRITEAERLAEEQRQMELELMRLKQEEEQRLEMELLEEKLRLKTEQEQLPQLVITAEGQEQKTDRRIHGPEIMLAQGIFQPLQGSISSLPQIEKLQQVVITEEEKTKQQHKGNPFLNKINIGQEIKPQLISQPLQSSTRSPISSYPTQQTEKSDESIVPAVRYIQSSQHSIGSKHQNVKDDSGKIPPFDHASFQPADTAAALIHLEKVRQEHFRAHERALEQLRLARVQSTSLKDCNH
uniref:Trichohyalin n=1 Tax=Stomoxys calcitrans TaxID=35570 RepID=A0A1I8QCP1_STOCA